MAQAKEDYAETQETAVMGLGEPKDGDAEADYEYEPLPTPTSIRLLRLDPHPDPDDGRGGRLRVSLTLVDLADEPTYIALSYSWGNPHATGFDFTAHFEAVAREYDAAHRIAIDCGGRRLRVQQNLYDALRELPRPISSLAGNKEGEYLWVDAVCINQDDLAERAAQVRIMDRVYRQAACTAVWLGRADEYTAAAATTVQRIAGYPREVFASSNITPFRRGAPALYEAVGLAQTSWMDWCSLAALLKRQWFSRVWIVQETVLSRVVVVFCGRHRIAWADLVAAARTIDARCAVLGERSSTFFIQHGDAAVSLEFNLLRLADWRDYERDTPSEESNRRALTLEALLLDVWTFHATNPRDKIYGIFGLMEPAMRDTWRIDYTEPVEHVYAAATRRVIAQSCLLGVLSWVQDPSLRRIAARPSWVPDYSMPYLNMMCSGSGFSAAGVFAFTPPPPSSRWDRLRLRGAVVDAVAETANDRTNFINSMMLLEPSWFELALLLPQPYHGTNGQSRGEVLWRTLCADQEDTRDGSSSPAPPRFGRLFRELVCAMVVVRADLEAENACLRDPPEACAPSLAAALAAARTVWDEMGWNRPDVDLLHETGAPPRLLSHPDYGWLLYTLLKIQVLAKTEPEPEPDDGSEDGGCIPTWDFLEAFAANPTYVMRVVDGDEKHLRVPDDPAFINSFRQRYGKRKLFVTEKGYLGLGPASARVGDVACLLPGAAGPFLCRRCRDEGADGSGDGGTETLQVVGESYVHGIMHGEATEAEGFAMVEVELV